MSLVADNVSLALGGVRVLDDVSAAFDRGRVTAVLGPNGAGKSSLLACLAGLRTPSAGRILVDGNDRRAGDPRGLARRIGFLPQSGDVHWDVDVATLVGLGRLPYRGRWGTTPVDAAAVAAALAMTDVTSLASRVVNSLSGGERSRVLLARVLAGTPDWLLADEPLASLDPAHQLDVLGCLRGVARRGAGVVVVLHDLNLALRVADTIILMRAGRIIADGAPDAVLTEQRIAEAFGVAVQIGVSPDGGRFIVTTGRSAA